MNSKQTNKQSERFWKYRAEMAHHSDGSPIQKPALTTHEQVIIHIGGIYPVRDWRIFATMGTDRSCYRGLIGLYNPCTL